MKNPLLAVQIECRGLKCDTQDCDFVDSDILLNPKSIRENINRPCPKCGRSLLTLEDARTTFYLLWFARTINLIAFPFMVLVSPWFLVRWMLKKPNRDRLHCEFDGTGKVSFVRKD